MIDSSLLLAAALGVLVLVHGTVEVWAAARSGFEYGDGIDPAYAAVRTVQTVAAATYVGLVLVGGTLATFGGVSDDPPDTVVLAVLASGSVLLASVFAHAAGRTVRAVAGAVRSR